MQKYAETFEFDEERDERTIRITLLGEYRHTSFPPVADMIDEARTAATRAISESYVTRRQCPA